jgi:hypothetical protein
MPIWFRMAHATSKQKKSKNDNEVLSKTPAQTEDLDALVTHEVRDVQFVSLGTISHWQQHQRCPKSRMQEDYVIVEEYKDNQGRRGSVFRINIYDKPKEIRSKESRARDPSPLVQTSYVRHSQSAEDPIREKYVFRDRSLSPSALYVSDQRTTRARYYVESPPRSPQRREGSRENAKEDGVEDYYRGRSLEPRRPQEDSEKHREKLHRWPEEHYQRNRPEIADTVIRQGYEYRQTFPLRQHYVVEDRPTDTSSVRSCYASDRRRLDRNSEALLPYRHGELPHDIGPLRENEVVVVTERYVYRPKRTTTLQEEKYRDFTEQKSDDPTRQRQERIDAATLGVGKSCKKFSAESEASVYYHDDWSHERSRQEKEKEPRRRVRTRDIHEDYAHPQRSENVFDKHHDGMNSYYYWY